LKLCGIYSTVNIGSYVQYRDVVTDTSAVLSEGEGEEEEEENDDILDK
jgi:hypothetical protein